MKKIVEFCSKCSSCPVVEFSDDSVKIGEKDNVVTLSLSEFEDLKRAMLEGKL